MKMEKSFYVALESKYSHPRLNSSIKYLIQAIFNVNLSIMFANSELLKRTS